MKTGLKESVIDSLKAGGLDLDCNHICLTQDKTDSPRVFCGPGYIRQDGEKNLVFKIYPLADEQRGIERLGAPGLIIPPERFYTFTASDTHGNVWTGDWVLPEISICHTGERSVAIVYGGIQSLAIKGPPIASGAVNTLKLRFFTDEGIPCHSSTVVETNVADHRRQHSSTMNLVTITSCGCSFLLTQLSGEVVVEAWSTDPFPLHFESRIAEALQFVLARPIQWRVLQSETRHGTVFQIVSPSRHARSRLEPPINVNAVSARYWTWILFDRYLQFIARNPDPDWHPCSVLLSSVCEASAASIDAEILAMTVAAEGLTRALCPALVTVPEQFLQCLAAFKVVVDNWLKDNHAANEVGLANRLPGIFSMMKEVRAIDRLVQLQESGVIEQKHVDAWKKLRNAAAHSVAPGTREWQLLLDRRDLVVAMIYRIVFHAIGYEGKHSDYGTRQWPIVEFPQREVTERADNEGRSVCRTSAFSHELEWAESAEGPWEWTVSQAAVVGHGVAATKSEAEIAARKYAELCQIRTVVQETH